MTIASELSESYKYKLPLANKDFIFDMIAFFKPSP